MTTENEFACCCYVAFAYCTGWLALANSIIKCDRKWRDSRMTDRKFSWSVWWSPGSGRRGRRGKPLKTVLPPVCPSVCLWLSYHIIIANNLSSSPNLYCTALRRLLCGRLDRQRDELYKPEAVQQARRGSIRTRRRRLVLKGRSRDVNKATRETCACTRVPHTHSYKTKPTNERTRRRAQPKRSPGFTFACMQRLRARIGPSSLRRASSPSPSARHAPSHYPKVSTPLYLALVRPRARPLALRNFLSQIQAWESSLVCDALFFCLIGLRRYPPVRRRRARGALFLPILLGIEHNKAS